MQHQDNAALQLKIDELNPSMDGGPVDLLDLEELEEEQL
jgi:hypothetical protein